MPSEQVSLTSLSPLRRVRSCLAGPHFLEVVHVVDRLQLGLLLGHPSEHHRRVAVPHTHTAGAKHTGTAAGLSFKIQ